MKDFLKRYNIITATWLDAADDDDKKLDELVSCSVKDILYERKTTGHLVNEDEYGILLVTDIMQDSTCECVSIPKQMLQKIEYKTGRNCNGKKSNKELEKFKGCSRSAGEEHIV